MRVAFLALSQHTLELFRQIVGVCYISIVWYDSKKCLVFLIFIRKLLIRMNSRLDYSQFLDQVIRCELISVDINHVLPKVRPLALTANNAFHFISKLNNDTNFVTSQVQIHSRTYNATYFKDSSNKTQCRFNSPHSIIFNSYINNIRSISLQKNKVWINSWNPTPVSILQSNHNVTFVVLFNNALALIYYITNYAIKGNYSQYQRIIEQVL